MFLKMWLTCQLVLRVYCPNLGEIRQELTVEKVHVVNGVLETRLIECETFHLKGLPPEFINLSYNHVRSA